MHQTVYFVVLNDRQGGVRHLFIKSRDKTFTMFVFTLSKKTIRPCRKHIKFKNFKTLIEFMNIFTIFIL